MARWKRRAWVLALLALLAVPGRSGDASPGASGPSAAEHSGGAEKVSYARGWPVAADLAIFEADAVAAKWGGAAFEPLAPHNVSSEIHVLQGIGDPDLECDDETATGDRDEQCEDYLRRGLSPLSASIQIPLENGTVISWHVEAGQCFYEAAEAMRRHHQQTRATQQATGDVVAILIRNEITKLAVLGADESGCRPSPNFQRLSDGRLRSRLSQNVERLISQYAFQGPAHLHTEDEVQGEDRLFAIMKDPTTG
jgi:hypothetical protein